SSGSIFQMVESSANAGTPPDVLSIDAVELELYLEKGYLADLAPFFGANDIHMQDYFSERLIEIASPNGTPSYIPWEVDLGQVVYKKSWFDQANIPYPTPEWTWDDFVTISTKLAENNPGKYGAVIPFTLPTLEGLIIGNGGTLLSPDGTTAQG